MRLCSAKCRSSRPLLVAALATGALCLGLALAAVLWLDEPAGTWVSALTCVLASVFAAFAGASGCKSRRRAPGPEPEPAAPDDLSHWPKNP